MSRISRYLPLAIALVALYFAVRRDTGSPGATAAVDATAKEKSGDSSSSHTVTKEPFKVEVNLDGIVEATQMHELACHTEGWKELSLQDVLEHGKQVKKDDVVATFNPIKIDEEIRGLEKTRPMAEAALAQTLNEIQTLEQSMPAELLQAERSSKFANEDLKQFQDVGRALDTRRVELMVTNLTNILVYIKEELRQLEKMYKADDLTEETEEMILRRQRDEVQFFTNLLEIYTTERDRTVNFRLPQQEEKLRAAADQQTAALDKAKATLPVQLEKLKIDAERQKIELAKSADRLAQLRQDREAMTIRAPADGIVYYGACNRGQWTTTASVAPKMQRGGVFQPHEVIMTIVNAQPIFLRAVVPEKDLQYVRAGLSGEALPTSLTDVKRPVKIEAILPIPVAAGKFDARLQLVDADGLSLMPGSACALKFAPYVTADALTVPAASVFTDELDSNKQYVYLAVEGGKPERRFVKRGHYTDKTAEIVEGLKEGDKVLLKKPGA